MEGGRDGARLVDEDEDSLVDARQPTMPGDSPSIPGDSLRVTSQLKPTDASLEVTATKEQASDSAHAHQISHP